MKQRHRKLQLVNAHMNLCHWFEKEWHVAMKIDWFQKQKIWEYIYIQKYVYTYIKVCIYISKLCACIHHFSLHQTTWNSAPPGPMKMIFSPWDLQQNISLSQRFSWWVKGLSPNISVVPKIELRYTYISCISTGLWKGNPTPKTAL